jgi:hypothetical protein
VTEFWPTAWEALRQARGPDGGSVASASAEALARDLAIQRFVFEHKRAPGVNRFGALREAGVFDFPPEIERVEGGLRARGWPAMSFLERVVRRHGEEIAEILSGLQSDNWWVISDGLDIASQLNRVMRASPILHLLELWQEAPIKWIQPRQAAGALAALAEIEGADRALEAALTRVSIVLLNDGENVPDLEEILSEVFERLDHVHHGALMTGIETALAMPSVRSKASYRFERDGLRNVRRGSSDAIDAMLALWTQMIDAASTDEHSSELLLGRAVRLLAAEPVLLRQMGIVALGAALEAKPDTGAVGRVFNDWITSVAVDWLTEWRYPADLLDLLRAHRRRLTLDSTAKLLGLALTWAASVEVHEQLQAWYLLGALKSSLGPRELMILASLESTHGEATGRLAPMGFGGGWVGERSAIPPEDLMRMSPMEIIDATAFVPSIGDKAAFSNGATVSGFAQALKSQILLRADELVPVAADIAARARDSDVVCQVAWALREVIAPTDAEREMHRDDVLRFISALSDRIQIAKSTDPASVRSLETALVQLLEGHAVWLDTHGSDVDQRLTTTLATLLSSADPDPGDGFAADDPPMRGMNSVRGTAALAALRLASSRFERDMDYGTLLALLERHLTAETDPGALSAYGRYLGSIAVYWPEFLTTYRHQLLPPSPDALTRWQSVFITYVAFNSPHAAVAPRLVDEYVRAVDELSKSELPRFFGEHVNRLIGHLVGLALAGRDVDPTWRSLLVRALTIGPPDGVAQVIHDLASAVRREGLELQEGWVLDLLHPQIDALRHMQPSDSSKVARSWVELILAAQIPVSSAGGALVSLAAIGGKAEENDLVDYLSNVDQPPSRMGARLLRDAAEAGAFDGYVRDRATLSRLVRQYARTHRDLAWELVNRLGRAGMFEYERLARTLVPESPSSAESR